MQSCMCQHCRTVRNSHLAAPIVFTPLRLTVMLQEFCITCLAYGERHS
jgi:hypothetical protein